MTPIILLAALGLDALLGDPDWLWRRAPHPVVVVGRAIAWMDERWNRTQDGAVRGKLAGIGAVMVLVLGSVSLGLALASAFERIGALGAVLEIALVAILLAQRSLAAHVGAVRDGLRSGLPAGRRAVSMIVGRDTSRLDESGVARGAIESLAENFADGVVAPAMWYLIGGLPGMLAYKAVNTADSMIGHRSERYRLFGWASARLDDVMNWPAARLAAMLLLAVRPRGVAGSWQSIRADAARHRSPNAGWPEAAMAAILGLALGGPRSYGDGTLNEPYINADGRRSATVYDIQRALAVFRDACLALAVLVGVLAIA